MISSVSVFDVPFEESEKIYHAFVLGILVGLKGKYDVKSNREWPVDVMLFPKNTDSLGIIMEFKRSNALTKWAQKQRLMLQSCKSKKKDMPKNSSIGAFIAFCILDLLSKEKKFLSVTNLETSEFFPKGAGL